MIVHVWCLVAIPGLLVVLSPVAAQQVRLLHQLFVMVAHVYLLIILSYILSVWVVMRTYCACRRSKRWRCWNVFCRQLVDIAYWHLEVLDLIFGEYLLGLVIIDNIDLIPHDKCGLMLALWHICSCFPVILILLTPNLLVILVHAGTDALLFVCSLGCFARNVLLSITDIARVPLSRRLNVVLAVGSSVLLIVCLRVVVWGHKKASSGILVLVFRGLPHKFETVYLSLLVSFGLSAICMHNICAISRLGLCGNWVAHSFDIQVVGLDQVSRAWVLFSLFLINLRIFVILRLSIVETTRNEIVLLEELQLWFWNGSYRFIVTVPDTELHLGVLFLGITNKVSLALIVILAKEHALGMAVLVIEAPLLLRWRVLLNDWLLQLLVRIEVVHGRVLLEARPEQLLTALVKILLLYDRVLYTLSLILSHHLHTLWMQSSNVLGPGVLLPDPPVVVEALTLLFIVSLVLLVYHISSALDVLLLA